MNDCIVTIGRENGSGGRVVGRIVADLLGVRCYDREIIEATATKTGLSIEEVERSEENRRRSPFYFGGDTFIQPHIRRSVRSNRRSGFRGPMRFRGKVRGSRPEGQG